MKSGRTPSCPKERSLGASVGRRGGFSHSPRAPVAPAMSPLAARPEPQGKAHTVPPVWVLPPRCWHSLGAVVWHRKAWRHPQKKDPEPRAVSVPHTAPTAVALRPLQLQELLGNYRRRNKMFNFSLWHKHVCRGCRKHSESHLALFPSKKGV